MEITTHNNVIFLKGTLDESVDSEEISAAVKKVVKGRPEAPVIIDLSELNRSNSAGIRKWIQFTKSCSITAQVENAPVWFGEQASMIPDITTNLLVRSLNLPFLCEEKESSKTINCRIGVEIPVLESYEDFQMKLEVDGLTYQLDGATDIFNFIAEELVKYDLNISEDQIPKSA